MKGARPRADSTRGNWCRSAIRPCSLVGFGSKTVTVETESGPSPRQVTDPDIAYYAIGEGLAQTYWKMNLADGTVTALGDRIVTSQPPGPAKRFDCRYEGNGTGVYTLVVVDAETRQDLASIDRVVGLTSCPRYPDRYLAVVRLDENEAGRLWTGPFDGLVRAELDLAIDQYLRGNWSYEPDPAKWRMTVLATAGPAPAGRGIYAIDLTQLSTEAVIPPALPDVIWAPGAAPSGVGPVGWPVARRRRDRLRIERERHLPLSPANERRQRSHVHRTAVLAGVARAGAVSDCRRNREACSSLSKTAFRDRATSSPGSRRVRPVRTPTCS